ncbi:YMGG-like glycine zipper-containing protein [Desulfosediminicola flagellatus]|uniref:YMGG-like glycine zipper-containing protein n=1 Tax=Desulfosediminicola flagellatus TaxID=2569541 RepID=UPI001C3DC9D3|nr:YMGG-like glycine zipper-containing protein [Desulfosediminicola flagellatus]
MKIICSQILLASLLVSMLFMGVGCSPYATPAQHGAVRGGAVGAVAGQAIGRDTKSTLIGAGAGALGGALLNDERARRRGYGY